MSKHDLEKLLGGFAADQLTPEEKQALFVAALQDQQLFNALADEQALKELLADPVVRQRLLLALKQTAPSRLGSSLSWFDWLRRPANLAAAGGLAAAVFAFVFGTKIYQDSFKQITQSITTEESKPASLPTPTQPALSLPPSSPLEGAEPHSEAKENALPATEPVKKDGFADRMVKSEKRAPLKPEEQRVSPANHDQAKQRPKQDGLGRQSAAPAIGVEKTADELKVSADQRSKTSERPVAAPEAPPPMQAQPAGSATGNTAPIAGARALFYAAEAARVDQKTMEVEHEQSLKSTTEARRSLRSEQKIEVFAASSTAAQLKPLGLRYGFAIHVADGKAQETDAATALKSGGQARLTIEVNQDAYVQIWKTAGSSTPQLWFPTEETGQISTKVPAGRRQGIPLTAESQTFTLTVRLSRAPFGPITEQEAAMLVIPSNQLHETITPHDSTGSQEQATYIVNPNPSPTVQLIVEIPLMQ